LSTLMDKGKQLLLEGPSDGLSQVNLAFMVIKLFCLGSYKNVNLLTSFF
jgi:hypothetical protein